MKDQTCILCCISMKLAEPMPRLPMPAMPPKPPSPKGDCPTLGGGGAEFGDEEVVVVEDGLAPAAAVVVEAAAAGAPEEPEAVAAPPCLMTRWIVIPSLMLWLLRFSVSFSIFPANIRQRFSMGALLNLIDMASLN